MSVACVLSVVIPACNVGRFIARCVCSVGLQRMAPRVEVIVVDDGSTDDTAQVVDALAAGIDGIRMVRQSNTGLGGARNRGLQAALGDYVWFVDGDDFLGDGAVDQVVAVLEAQAPDILVVDFACADENGAPVEWIACPFGQDHGHHMSGGGFFRRHHATTYAWLYIFRRQLLSTHGLAFQPRINMQDAEFMPRVLAMADDVLVSGIDAYVYVKRADSFINSPDPGVRDDYFRSVLEVRRRMLQFLRALDASEIREGVVAKLHAIDRILLRSYVYEAVDARALSVRLSLLRQDGVYPFAPLVDACTSDHLLRFAVNLRPLLVPGTYRWLRGNPLLRRVSDGVRRTCGAS